MEKICINVIGMVASIFPSGSIKKILKEKKKNYNSAYCMSAVIYVCFSKFSFFLPSQKRKKERRRLVE